MKKLSEMLDDYVVITTDKLDKNNNLYIINKSKIYKGNASEMLDYPKFEKNVECEVFSVYENNEEKNIANVDGYENEFDYVDKQLNDSIIEEYYNYLNSDKEEEYEDYYDRPFVNLHYQNCTIIQVN